MYNVWVQVIESVQSIKENNMLLFIAFWPLVLKAARLINKCRLLLATDPFLSYNIAEYRSPALIHLLSEENRMVVCI